MGFWHGIWDTLGDSYRRTKWYKPDNPPMDPVVPDPVPDVPLEPGDFVTALTESDWGYITDMFTSMNETLMVIILAVGGLALFMLLRR